MYLKSYKELVVWQKSIELVKKIYPLTANFPQEEIYGLTSQMRRCAISIPSNIAEGYSRKSMKEYIYFLQTSYDSSRELETQLIIAKDLYKNTEYHTADLLLEEVLKMLNVMIAKLENKNN